MKTLLVPVLALFALATALPATSADNVQLAQASAAAPQKYKVVIQVSDPDPRLWAQAINYSENPSRNSARTTSSWRSSRWDMASGS